MLTTTIKDRLRRTTSSMVQEKHSIVAQEEEVATVQISKGMGGQMRMAMTIMMSMGARISMTMRRSMLERQRSELKEARSRLKQLLRASTNQKIRNPVASTERRSSR